MIRDIRRIILGYAEQMNRLEARRDYLYLRSHECMLSEFKFLNRYTGHVISRFPYMSVDKRVLCIEGFYLPLYIGVNSRRMITIYPGAILVI